MKPNILSQIHTSRVNEASLQKILEAMIGEIRQLKLGTSNEKKIVAMLMTYRSAWNSYINTFKGKTNRSDLKGRIDKFMEFEKGKKR